MERILIGLTGRMASGKGEVIKILEQKGLRKTSLSDMVRAEVKSQGKEVTRSQMQDIGNGLRMSGGAGILGKLIKESIEQSGQLNWVIDGIRNPAEIVYLRELQGFFLIGVKAGENTLLKRIKNRGRDTDNVSDEEIKAVLKREWGIGEPLEGQRVGDCIKESDFLITNDGSLEELSIKINEILEKIGEKNV